MLLLVLRQQSNSVLKVAGQLEVRIWPFCSWSVAVLVVIVVSVDLVARVVSSRVQWFYNRRYL